MARCLLRSLVPLLAGALLGACPNGGDVTDAGAPDAGEAGVSEAGLAFCRQPAATATTVSPAPTTAVSPEGAATT
jgi:hypothetical protein